MAAILEHNLAFLDAALAAGELGYAALERSRAGQTPLIERAIAVAARAQVHHWTGVLAGWRRELGAADWDRLYAATNTLYMTRTRNTLFELLAQAMGEAAIDERLFLFETLAYTTEPDAMLEMLTRVVADRALGQVFFRTTTVWTWSWSPTRSRARSGTRRRGGPQAGPAGAGAVPHPRLAVDHGGGLGRRDRVADAQGWRRPRSPGPCGRRASPARGPRAGPGAAGP